MTGKGWNQGCRAGAGAAEADTFWSEPEPQPPKRFARSRSRSRQKRGGSGSEKRQRNPEEFVTYPVSATDGLDDNGWQILKALIQSNIQTQGQVGKSYILIFDIFENRIAG